ncbi:sugar transferase [Cellulomonas iranensis]|uniref:sugar transferase n=1 Tax=Cellulomonas iranensis TaxID=76862 RepID=UPI003D7C82DA
MTLTAGERVWGDQGDDRRGRALEPRRSWASSEPFVRRRTVLNSDPLAQADGWRAVRVRHALAVAGGDATVVGATTAVVYRVHSGLLESLVVAGVAAAAFVLLVAFGGGYGRRQTGDGPGEFQVALRAALAFVVALILLGYVFRLDVPRSYVLVGVPVALALTWCVRLVAQRRLRRRRALGHAMQRTVVVGDAFAVGRLVRDLSRAPHHGYRIDGVCLPSVDLAHQVAGVPVLGAVADVVQVVADRGAEVVLVTGSCLSGEALRRLSWALSRAGARLVVVPDLVEVAGPRLTVRPAVGLSLLEVEVGAPRGRLLLKQAMDATMAGAALVVLLPVLLVAAAAVALTSPGGAVYRQTRVGRDGTTFTMYKLRTMYRDADERRAALLASGHRDGVLFKMADDPRVTPVGRVLRRFSIDELPQLLNIVRGEMAVVGPRPPLLEEVAVYPDEVQRRLHVKPGLTGLWQVSGRSDLSWEESVRLDLRYVDNWSVAMDMLIIWKTARAVLTGAGAY